MDPLDLMASFCSKPKRLLRDWNHARSFLSVCLATSFSAEAKSQPVQNFRNGGLGSAIRHFYELPIAGVRSFSLVTTIFQRLVCHHHHHRLFPFAAHKTLRRRRLRLIFSFHEKANPCSASFHLSSLFEPNG